MHKRRPPGGRIGEPPDSINGVLKGNFGDTPEQRRIREIDKILNETNSVTGIHGCVDGICFEFGFRGFREKKEIVGLHDLKHELGSLQVREEALEKKLWDAEYPDHKEAEEVVRRIFDKDVRDDALGKKVDKILESISKRQGRGNIDMGELIRELRKTHRPPDYKEILKLKKDMVATRLDAYEKVLKHKKDVEGAERLAGTEYRDKSYYQVVGGEVRVSRDARFQVDLIEMIQELQKVPQQIQPLRSLHNRLSKGGF